MHLPLINFNPQSIPRSSQPIQISLPTSTVIPIPTIHPFPPQISYPLLLASLPFFPKSEGGQDKSRVDDFRLFGYYETHMRQFYHLHQPTEGPLEKQERVHSPGSGVCGENGHADEVRPCFLLIIIPDPGYYWL